MLLPALVRLGKTGHYMGICGSEERQRARVTLVRDEGQTQLDRSTFDDRMPLRQHQ